MISNVTLLSRALRSSALCAMTVFLLVPPAAMAFNPDEGAEPVVPRTRSRLPSTAPLVDPMPKIVFPERSVKPVARQVPLENQAIPAMVDSAVPAPAPIYPPVDAAIATRAESELRAMDAVQVPPMPAAAILPPSPGFVAPAPVLAAAPPEPLAEPNALTVPLAPMPVAAAVPYAPEKLSDDTKKILSAIPSKLNTPKGKKGGKVGISRMSPDIQNLVDNSAKMESYDSVGLSIKVHRSGLDANYELNRAYTALMGGDTTQAIEVYKNILSSEPNNQDALFGLAATYHRLGDVTHARPFYGQLLKFNPNHREGLNNFLALVSDESPQESLAELERLEQRNPDFSPIPAQQAVVLDKLGYKEQARDKMLRAIELAPENLTYKYNLAVMLDRDGDYRDAGNLYRLLIDASMRGEKIPASADTLQKRLNFIATATNPPTLVGG